MHFRFLTGLRHHLSYLASGYMAVGYKPNLFLFGKFFFLINMTASGKILTIGRKKWQHVE